MKSNENKIVLSDEQLTSIADELDSDFIVYLNKETLETVSIPDFDRHPFPDEDVWDDTKKEIRKIRNKSIRFTPMDTHEAFEVMEDFVETVNDRSLQDLLWKILSMRKPFRNFKDVVERSPYREKWFQFKLQANIKYVKLQLARSQSSDGIIELDED